MAFGGFLLAFYIHHTKKTGEKLVCPVGASCDTVVHSVYSRFWGMPVELFGLAYYGLIAVSYGLFVIFPHFITPLAVFVVLGITIVASLFSAYLTFIQAFNIKQWCSWCLVSAGICASIFILALLGVEISLAFVLGRYYEFILISHIVGMALGVGGATIADVFYIKFLKHFRLSATEAEVLHTIHQFTWFALALIVLSGVGLYIPKADLLNQSSLFPAKMIVILVIIINGALLNLLISPRLIRISFGEKHAHEVGELHSLRKWSFAFSAVSLVSWYTAFILGFLSGAWSFGMIVLVYLGLVIAAVIFSQILEYIFDLNA